MKKNSPGRGERGMIQFQRIGIRDLPILQAIYNYYCLHSTATFKDAPITQQEFEKDIDFRSPVYQTFLIRENGNLLGYCGIRRYKPLKAYDRMAEVTIYLKPEYTGQGIGRVALRYLEDHAGRSGIRMFLAIITSENFSSVRLFEGMGYAQCAHLKNVGELSGRLLDVLYYQKDL
ncbi:MAG: N-acetyltransferase family protein [Methanospirillum sp.]